MMSAPQNETPENGHPPPRVSIGVPVYNGEKYLSQSLDALLGQTFGDFEIIISDNASTDGTGEIAREYMARDKRIRYYKNERNMGAVYNFNHTLELATGTFFKWAAADDVIRPEFLSACLEALNRNPGAVLAYSKAAFIDESDRVMYGFDDIMHLKPWSNNPVRRACQMLEAVFLDGSAANVFIFGLVRTGSLRAIRPLGNYFGCDYVAVTELALEGGICEVPEVLSFYRRHSGSSSTYKKSPSAASQQAFYDPSITGRIRQEFHLRRRYFEIFNAIGRAELKFPARLRVMLTALSFIFRRTLWRVGFEIRASLGRLEPAPGKGAKGIGLHWSEYS